MNNTWRNNYQYFFFSY